MSNNNNPLATKLTGYDFHAYLDGQISEEDFARIETTVSKHPKVILQLQQCIMIGERFQEMYGEPVTGPLKSSQQISERPQLHEPALVNDESMESDDALVAVDALELDSNDDFSSPPQGRYASDADEEMYAEAPVALVDTVVEDANPYSQSYADSEPSQDTYQTEFNAAHNDEYTDDFANDLNDNYTGEQEHEEIQVENLLQGISEVEALSQRQDDPLVGQIHGMEIYTQPDRGWFGNLIHGAKDRIRAKISLYRYKIQQKRLNKLLAESEETFVDNYNPEYNNEFEYNIESDIQSQDPPRWQFWKARAPQLEIGNDPYDNEYNDPFGYNNEKFSRLREWSWNLLNKLHIPENWHNRVLIAGLTLVSFVLGLLLSSKPVSLDTSSIIYQAIDAHKYYASHGFETLHQGLPKLNDDLALMAKTVGAKPNQFSLENTDYKRTGAILLPSINGYASMQLLQNGNKQNVTLFATAWSDPDLEPQHVVCKVPAGISSACFWQDDAFYYVMTSDISLSRVRTIAEKLALQNSH